MMQILVRMKLNLTGVECYVAYTTCNLFNRVFEKSAASFSSTDYIKIVIVVGALIYYFNGGSEV